jgi:hypothetical protein
MHHEWPVALDASWYQDTTPYRPLVNSPFDALRYLQPPTRHLHARSSMGAHSVIYVDAKIHAFAILIEQWWIFF